jgi:hypothetical protein
MAEILGLGCTHWPTLCGKNDTLTGVFHRVLNAPNVDPHYKDPANWPAELLAELGNDNGMAAANRCGERFGNDFRAIRKILDDFNPDFVLVWGDDQYENFKEDIVPPFAILGYDPQFDLQPWHNGNGGKPNRWDEPGDWRLPLKGHREAAKYIATSLIEKGIDLAYAYKPLHHPMAHAFTNTFLYLDWDRKGFPYPVVPFAINCYGRNLIKAHGAFGHLYDPQDTEEVSGDPPSPQPWRCMDVGAAIAEALAKSPYRVALIASSSWSHCFLSPKNGYLWPDHEGDRILFNAVEKGDYATWRKRSLEDMEFSGQHEMLNWMALMGAMEAIGRGKPVIQDYMETHILASDKCFLSFPA